MKILETSVYLGPNHYALFPVIRLRVDLGELEDWPTRRLGAGFVDALLDALPGLQRARLLLRRARRLPPPHATRTTARGSVTCSSTWRSRSRTWRAPRSASARRASAGEDGVYDVVYEYEQEDVGLEAGDLALTLVHALLPRSLRPEGAVPPRLRLRRRARRVHPLRAATRARPQHGRPGEGGRGAGHPAPPAQSATPSSSSATASTSGGSRPPSPARRATSPSRSPPTRRRPTGSSTTWACPVPHQDAGVRRGAGDPGRAPHRVPGRREAPRAPTTDAASRSASRPTSRCASRTRRRGSTSARSSSRASSTGSTTACSS